MRIFFSALTGLIFGVGLILSGMSNPLKVQNFLDVFGTWDPSLALVMGGAILIGIPGFFFVAKRKRPLFFHSFFAPAGGGADKKLIAGAAMFGVGWGIAGFCPGPAIVSVSLLNMNTLYFVGPMLLGMWLARETKRSKIGIKATINS